MKFFFIIVAEFSKSWSAHHKTKTYVAARGAPLAIVIAASCASVAILHGRTHTQAKVIDQPLALEFLCRISNALAPVSSEFELFASSFPVLFSFPPFAFSSPPHLLPPPWLAALLWEIWMWHRWVPFFLFWKKKLVDCKQPSSPTNNIKYLPPCIHARHTQVHPFHCALQRHLARTTCQKSSTLTIWILYPVGAF